MTCKECKFAQPFIDPFNRKQRLLCGKGREIVLDYGDTMLLTSEYVKDCKEGEVKA